MTQAAEQRLRSELDLYEAAYTGIAALGGRGDRERLHELVRRRRAMAERIANLRDAGIGAFAADPKLAEDFRARFSTLVSLIALHQANWPAVKIDTDLDGYRRSAKVVTEAQHSFIRWARAQIGRLPAR